MRDQYLWTVAAMANTPTVTPVAASTMKRSLMFAVLAVFTVLTSEETDRTAGRGSYNSMGRRASHDSVRVLSGTVFVMGSWGFSGSGG